MEETEVKSKPWQWPREWVRDEKFWREVTARGLSGLIVVAIWYCAAVAGGFIAETMVFRTLLAGGAALLYIGITVWFLIASKRPKHTDDRALNGEAENSYWGRDGVVQVMARGLMGGLWFTGLFISPVIVAMLIP